MTDSVTDSVEAKIDGRGADPVVSSQTRAVLRELLLQLHTDLERRERVEAHFTRRLRWSLILLGFVALLGAGLMYA